MKSMGGSGELVSQGAVTPAQALRYAMSLPVATTVSGIDSIGVLRQNLEVARNFEPFTPARFQRSVFILVHHLAGLGASLRRGGRALL
jgi:uncharacterized protein